MELKYTHLGYTNTKVQAFNRTNMELKYLCEGGAAITRDDF